MSTEIGTPFDARTFQSLALRDPPDFDRASNRGRGVNLKASVPQIECRDEERQRAPGACARGHA